MSSNTLEAIKYTRGKLLLLNQLLLPSKLEFENVDTVEKTFDAIAKMKVRGAPAIAISAALGVAVEAHALLLKKQDVSSEYAEKFLCEKLNYLTKSRPTAVNLFNAVESLKKYVSSLREQKLSGNQILEKYIEKAEYMLEMDCKDNENISKFGSKYIQELYPEKKKLKILTHCNTGALATCKYGTALGVIRFLHKDGVLERVFATETRPYMQGCRLTCFECVFEKIPVTLIVDSAVSYLLKNQGIDAVIVGADRVCKNGDTANKIGTYQLAIACKFHKIPFLVAAPSSSFDLKAASGDKIKIEMRSETEVTHVKGTRIAAEGIQVWNPAFDVTPAELITAIVTEKGVLLPNSKGSYEEATEKLK